MKQLVERLIVPGKIVKRTTMHSVKANFTKVTAEKKTQNGTSIVWFRNDLRVHDNEVLLQASQSSETVIPVYCFDPRHFEKTHYFGFPKTGGKFTLSLVLVSHFLMVSLLSFPSPIPN